MMNKRQLERWLMKEVHGVEVPRQRRPKSVLGAKPARDWKYRLWIRSLPCAGCGLEPAGEAAHTETGGIQTKGSDYSCVPLCTDCHTLGAGAWHRVGRAAFEAARGICCAELVRRLNKCWWLAKRRDSC